MTTIKWLNVKTTQTTRRTLEANKLSIMLELICKP